jgi:hypothetical protein
MKNYIIAFCGKARSGKNTAAEMVRNHLSDSKIYVHEMSFAAQLKLLAKDLFKWRGDKTMYPVEVKDRGRNLLINIGKAMREIRPSVWVDYVATEINERCLLSNDHLFLITDARFQNEISILKSTSVDKVITVRLDRKSGGENIDDPSEKDLDGYTYDYIIEAESGELDTINQQLYLILEQEGLL